MLGQMVVSYFSKRPDLWDVRLVELRVTLATLCELQKRVQVPNSVIINCVARIPQGASVATSDGDYVHSNAVVPLLLRQLCLESQRIVHMSTNGVFPLQLEPGSAYSVDCELRDQTNAYALSKTLGETACAKDSRILIVRASIIGPAKSGRGLLEFVTQHANGDKIKVKCNQLNVIFKNLLIVQV
jgi:dTDP-4-dehydrorhamnose reductase